MIYEARRREFPLAQGDIFEECSLVYWTAERDAAGMLQLLTASANGPQPAVAGGDASVLSSRKETFTMQNIELDDQTAGDLAALAGARGLTVAQYLKSLITSPANGSTSSLSLDELDAELEALALDLPTLPSDFSRAHIYDEQD